MNNEEKLEDSRTTNRSFNFEGTIVTPWSQLGQQREQLTTLAQLSQLSHNFHNSRTTFTTLAQLSQLSQLATFLNLQLATSATTHFPNFFQNISRKCQACYAASFRAWRIHS